MQSDGLKENYNRKLDEIIEFFKTEKETWTFYLIIGKEDNKFDYNTYISIIALIAGFFTILLNIDSVKQLLDLKLLDLILLSIAALLLLLALYILLYSRSSKKMNHLILDRTISFNTIISFLQSLKILPYEVDLSKLVNKIKYYYHLDTIYSVKDGKYMSETWLKEVDGCLNEINKEIFEKERNASSQQV
ncbi:MAG TPA: hypothetical protein VIO58_09295 [Candidatus Methanoperedens sp.]